MWHQFMTRQPDRERTEFPFSWNWAIVDKSRVRQHQLGTISVGADFLMMSDATGP